MYIFNFGNNPISFSFPKIIIIIQFPFLIRKNIGLLFRIYIKLLNERHLGYKTDLFQPQTIYVPMRCQDYSQHHLRKIHQQ